jgi:hypothetical protein
MARPFARDLFAWFTTLPASMLLVICLFVPQFEDCKGREHLPMEVGTGPGMIAMAVLGVLPLVWRWQHELVAALASFTAVLGFLVIFPLAGVLAEWRDGAYVTWGALWLELAGMISWSSAAAVRSARHRALRSATRARAADPAAR